MKLRRSDIGKKVRIIKTNGANYISKTLEYLIKGITEDGGIIFSGISYVWYGTEKEHFEFVECLNENMEIGDFVIVLEKTTTLKQGDEKQIIDFLCGDKNKIVLDGIIPGGWIEPRKLVKKIDISNLRIKKAIELVKQKGICFYAEMYLNQSVKDILGKDLSELEIRQIGKRLVTKNGNGFAITEDLYTDLKYEELDIFITTNPENIGYMRSSMKSDKSAILGKKLSDLRKNFNSQSDDDVAKLSCEISNNGGYIRHGEFSLMTNSFKITKSSEYELQTAVSVSSPL